ncbi:DUF6461 domain-containing protein [Plantactinospora soyae]|uniref:Uncharacterized protein n=1 Tax=Plantactinospora soyae TaxID=1544732 RepID=A0A927M582_9ACTN|nr:DUF6461 domain-containing protein [Plantactinospora soyae]MBE1488214.1 hypothetical protein [Plantactinospora soyae]
MSEALVGWGWVKPLLSVGFCLTVVRGRDVRRLADDLGFDPEVSAVLERGAAVEEFGVAEPVVRVGSAGDWSFAFQEDGVEVGQLDLLRTLSTSGEAVTVWKSASAMAFFGYARDGQVVVGFEPDIAHVRLGSAPDELVDQQRLVGLDPDRPMPGDGEVSPVLRALALLSQLTGVRLAAGDIEGPLLSDWLNL